MWTIVQVHPMIKTLGPFEDAPALHSIAPVLHQWSQDVQADPQVCCRHTTCLGHITSMLAALHFLSCANSATGVNHEHLLSVKAAHAYHHS